MNQKRNKGRYNPQFKTFISEQSCIDVFSKVESLFLQKFFRYNISDYFPDTLLNLEEDIMQRKTKNKQLKQLSSQIFLSKSSISIDELEKKIDHFYASRTKIVQQGDFPFTFKFLYSNMPELNRENAIQSNQYSIIQVKMRAENQKIQSLPSHFYRELQLCENEGVGQEVLTLLKNYKLDSINLIIVYFGDINFKLFSKDQYHPKKIMFFGREVRVKILVFYISRTAMIDCFKKINKIQNMEYINDLLIQLYEFKRDKIRSKRLKNQKQKNLMLENQNMMRNLKWFGILSLSTAAIGVIILKYIIF